MYLLELELLDDELELLLDELEELDELDELDESDESSQRFKHSAEFSGLTSVQ